jgi:tetratricopeptide (TPR) repeat protein
MHHKPSPATAIIAIIPAFAADGVIRSLKAAAKAVQRVVLTVLALFALAVTPAAAASPELARLQREWSEIKYKTPRESQEQAFSALARVSESLVARNPGDVELLIWHGIIESSQAGAKGGLGALALVKNAKKAFERAIEINAAALEGSALTSLGSLYYQVPGWPIGFGDDKKALEFLKKGLEANPDGLDSNFFYGDFLFRSGDLGAAEAVLRKALRAPARSGRALADEGRRGEIEDLLRRIAEKRR